MQPDDLVSREGASTPYYRPTRTEVPALVIFPLSAAGAGITAEEAQAIYTLAHERALAACRPSIWQLAQHICLN